ncbi:MAG: hypothetical protein CSB15_00335 [Clostridiales bacterium]|nr:MAG: hypothetical protein CSB15_00335 [Clostridiales bacterium]
MEKWDLYDKDFNKLEKTMYRGDKVPKNCYRLVVDICIFNSEDKMLISQRKEDKKHYPNYWEFSASGAVISSEIIEDAIKRETLEEIGLDINDENLRPYITIHSEHSFHNIYMIKKDLDIKNLKIQETEVKAIKWASKDEIKEMINKNEFMQYQDGIIDLLFSMINKRGMIRL